MIIYQIDGHNMFRSYDISNQNDGVVVYIYNTLSVSFNQLLLGTRQGGHKLISNLILRERW